MTGTPDFPTDEATPTAPPITPQLIAFAHAHPGQQAYVIDSEFDPQGEVPGWAIRGYYPVTAEGTLDQRGWVGNPHYRPGPLERGFPRPRNRLERALQLTTAGHRPSSTLLTELATAHVVIPTSDQHPTQVPVLNDDGHDTIAMFTDPDHLNSRTPRVTVAVTDLAPLLPTVAVRLNPGLTPSTTINGADLAAALPSGPPRT